MKKRLIPTGTKLLSYSKKTKEMPGFSTAYEYRPKEFVEHEHGYFYVVLEIAGTDEGASGIADLIIGTAKEEYYSDLTREPLTSFESALGKVNEELADATEEGKINWLGKLSAIICVLVGRDLHVTRTGSAEAHLFREGKFTHITEELTLDKNEEPHPLKTFVNIASGTIEEGDRVLLLTPGIYHYLSKDEIERYASEYSPNKAVKKLAELLDKEENDVISSLVLFEIATPETISKEALPEEPEEVWVGEPRGIESTLEGTKPIIKKTAHKTKGVLGVVPKFVKTGILPAISGAAGGVSGAFKKLKKKKEPKISVEEEAAKPTEEIEELEEKEEPKVKAVAEALDLELDDEKEELSEEPEEVETKKEAAEIEKIEEKEETEEEEKPKEEQEEEKEEDTEEKGEIEKKEVEEDKLEEEIEEVGEEKIEEDTEETKEDQKKIETELSSERKEELTVGVPKKPRKSFGGYLDPVLSKFSGRTSSLRHKKRGSWLKILIPILIIGLIVGGAYFYTVRQQRLKIQEYDSIYAEAQSKERDGENQLTSGDKKEASKLLHEALTLLDQLKETNYKESEIADLISLINSKIDEAEDIIRVTSEAAFDFSSISGSSPQALFLIGNNLYSFDQNHNSIYKIDLSTKEVTTDFASPAPDEKFKSATYIEDEGQIAFLAESSVWRFNPEGATIKKVEITPSGEWEKGTQITSYVSNLYILDLETNQIKKHFPTSGGYSRSVDWLETEVDLSGAASLTIDSNIYVLKSDGTVYKFYVGEKEDFSITDLPDPLKDPSYIYTTLDLPNIYILDNGNKRVIVLDKEGNFVKQYVSFNFSDLKGLVYNTENKTIYILSGTKVYEITE